MDGGGSKRTMLSCGGKAAPFIGWPQVLSGFWLLLAILFALPAQAAGADMPASSLDARTLLLLGIDLGVIAFAVGTAIICLRATRVAHEARRLAASEADTLRASESTLKTILAAEPQLVLAWTGGWGGSWSGGERPRVLAANLPASLGVPQEPRQFFRLAEWLEEECVAELEQLLCSLSEQGQPFNLMLRTRKDRHIEVDGRAAGAAIVVKVRELVGRRLEFAALAHRHKELDREVAALRALLDPKTKSAGRQEQPAPQAETRFRSFDRLATAFAVFDGQQRLSHFNQAYVDLWQLDPEWLAGHPRDGEILDRLRQARRLPEKADYQDWKRSWLGVYHSDAQVETEWHLPDGRTLHVIADSAAQGGVTYLYENVTALLSLESRYNGLIDVQRETLDTLREGVAVFGQDGRLRLYNRAFAAVWRLSPSRLDASPHIDDIIGWCRVLYDEPEQWERTKNAVTAIVAERHPYETQLDRADGSVIAAAALPLPDGGTLLTYVDVSDTKRAERALIERNEALEAADHLKTAFISHVSYELRTPLTNIIGFTELLQSPFAGQLNEKQREYLGDISASGRTLLSIIDDILDLATIDAGTLALSLSPVKISEIIEAAAQGVQERLQQKSLQLEIDVEPGIDRFVADGRRVAQMLYNLLSNAIGFSPAGEQIVLSCRRDRDMLNFTVADGGPGIPPDFQASAFDRFESRSHGSAHRGAGLGLSIVKSLAELHGGTVSLASVPGQGTRVTVRLPFSQAASPQAPIEVQRLRSSAG